jgi:hypothetical protein
MTFSVQKRKELMYEEQCEFCACRQCEDLTCRRANCEVCTDNEEGGTDYCEHQIVALDEDDFLWVENE